VAIEADRHPAGTTVEVYGEPMDNCDDVVYVLDVPVLGEW